MTTKLHYNYKKIQTNFQNNYKKQHQLNKTKTKGIKNKSEYSSITKKPEIKR